MRADIKALLASALAALSCACTTQQMYATAQQWQKQECLKLPDREERSRCEKSNAVSYERYQAEAEAARGRSKP